MIKYFDEFTAPWLHARAKDQLLNPGLDWNFPTFGAADVNLDDACFGRCAFNLATNVVNWNNVDSLTYVLDDWLDKNKDWFRIEQLGRCMMNFYTKGQQTAWHTDNTYNMPGLYSLLYYVNDGGGGTEFEDRQILHKENAGVFFDSYTRHRPIASNQPRRISVSWVIKGVVLK